MVYNINKQILRSGLLAAFTTLASSGAYATACDSALSSYESYITTAGQQYYATQLMSKNPECFAAAENTSRVSINATSYNQALAISGALGARLTGNGPVGLASAGTKGMAAGTTSGKWNLWGNLNQSDTEQKYNAFGGGKTRTDADVLTTVVGADYSLSQTMVVGLSASFDNADGWGQNGTGVRNRTDTHGYLVAPYIGIQLDKNFAFDASAGWGEGKFDTSTGTKADADRWFGAANLSYNRWLDRLQLTGKLSYLHGVENYGSTKSATGTTFRGTGATNTLGQLRAAVQAGYWINGFMPFASVAYSADVQRSNTANFGASDPTGRNAWLLGIGVNYYSVAKGISGGISYNHETGRSHQSAHNVMANLNFKF